MTSYEASQNFPNTTSCPCFGGVAGDFAQATLPDVLQASAVTFNQHWPAAADKSCQLTSIPDNPYTTGEKGVWHTQQSFYYRDNRFRKLNATTDETALSDRRSF